MRARDEVIALAVSDIHLSHKPPVARSLEPSWYDAMARPLDELSSLASTYKVPILCSGDIFDKWNSPPELINFALSKIYGWYAIPGQHDLPFHSYEDVKRSAYWTLVQAGRITPVVPETPLCIDNMILHAFPWEHKVHPCSNPPHTFGLNIALIHSYIWKKDHCYFGAPKASRVSAWKKRLRGYDVCLFGDNHRGFVFHKVLNCGGFMRRKTDEVDYRPSVGLIHSNGTIKRHFLDTSKDVLTITEENKEAEKLDLSEFLHDLAELTDSKLDFKEAVHLWMKTHPISKPTRRLILQALEKV